jgi:hypothetical protein
MWLTHEYDNVFNGVTVPCRTRSLQHDVIICVRCHHRHLYWMTPAVLPVVVRGLITLFMVGDVYWGIPYNHKLWIGSLLAPSGRYCDPGWGRWNVRAVCELEFGYGAAWREGKVSNDRHKLWGHMLQRSTSTTVGRLARDNKKLLVVIKMKKHLEIANTGFCKPELTKMEFLTNFVHRSSNLTLALSSPNSHIPTEHEQSNHKSVDGVDYKLYEWICTISFFGWCSYFTVYK